MRLSIEGYKSINTKQGINISGLSVIAGKNSSGKSSFMQPFLILKQTFESNTDSNALIINGENTDLTKKDQLLCKQTKSNKFSIYIEYDDGNKTKKTSQVVFEYDEKKGFISTSSRFTSKKQDITLSLDMSQFEIDNLVSELEKNDSTFSRIYRNFAKDKLKLINRIDNNELFLTLRIEPKKQQNKKENQFNLGVVFEFNPSGFLKRFAENIIHISGIRQSPVREYKLTKYNKNYQGLFDKYTATIIYNWSTEDEKKLNKLQTLIEDLELATNITTRKIDEAYIAIEISRFMQSPKTDTVNISDVGLGLSQVLPILVALIEAKENNIIYIEQPEIHLHPKAQFKLAKIFCNFVKNGKKIIVETHSSIFIRGLQIAVANNELRGDLFSLNWFHQNEEGNSIITEASLDEMGAFDDWPSDFDDIYLDVEGQYLDAVEKKMARG
ncbi:AAA family ATPase [Gilliamella sp. wkB112]|uniref:AAA family ATPase n=1 Tax=Gilliamella sp. wkB112 TaxID=3120257 RepID=UPI00080EACF9|nr:AAA family ATPase [Gilliamella apicola]OCG00334.1 hypothetical protein A9G12_04400 [Gilliamella apicola]